MEKDKIKNDQDVIAKAVEEALTKAKEESAKQLQLEKEKAVEEALKQTNELWEAKYGDLKKNYLDEGAKKALKAQEEIEAKKLSKLKEEEKQLAIEKELEILRAEKTQALAKASKLELERTRNNLAKKNNIPEELIKYVTGTEQDDILASIESLKVDFKISDNLIDQKSVELTKKALKGGGVKTQKSDQTSSELTVEDFKKMNMKEKQTLILTNPEEYDRLRNLKKE